MWHCNRVAENEGEVQPGSWHFVVVLQKWERRQWRMCSSPFCQVMAGRGAPEVSQCRITDMPSITVLSEGPAVMFGAMPVREAQQLHETQRRTTAHASSNTSSHSQALGNHTKLDSRGSEPGLETKQEKKTTDWKQVWNKKLNNRRKNDSLGNVDKQVKLGFWRWVSKPFL